MRIHFTHDRSPVPHYHICVWSCTLYIWSEICWAWCHAADSRWLKLMKWACFVFRFGVYGVVYNVYTPYMCLWCCVVFCFSISISHAVVVFFSSFFHHHLLDSVSGGCKYASVCVCALIPSIFLLFFNLFVRLVVCYVFTRCSFIRNLFLSSYLCFVARSWFWLLLLSLTFSHFIPSHIFFVPVS